MKPMPDVGQDEARGPVARPEVEDAPFGGEAGDRKDGGHEGRDALFRGPRPGEVDPRAPGGQ
jgi:hypothetical protein